MVNQEGITVDGGRGFQLKSNPNVYCFNNGDSNTWAAIVELSQKEGEWQTKDAMDTLSKLFDTEDYFNYFVKWEDYDPKTTVMILNCMPYNDGMKFYLYLYPLSKVDYN